MKKSIRFISVFTVLMFLIGMVGACSSEDTSSDAQTAGNGIENVESSQESGGETSEDDAKSEEPVPIRWVRAGNEQDPKQDRILQELQKRMNTEIEIVSIPWDQFPNKLNIMMSTGDQIDIANCDPGVVLNSWAKDGIILAWDEYLEGGKYPLIDAIVNSDLYSGLKIDGKVYYKPLPLAPQQWGFLIRTDWLKNVGLEKPTNLDKLYSVMKAFKEQDPDGNGKDDTYGWYVTAGGQENPSGNFAYMLRAYAINAGAGQWVEQPDGTVTRYEVSEAAKEGAKFVRRMIDEGLVNKDWMSIKRDAAQGPTSDAFANSQYGIANTSIPDVFVQKLKDINPDAEVEFLEPIQGVDGVPANAGHSGGFWWGNVIPKTAENPEKVLELIEYTLTKEGRELTHYGVEGVHFTDKKEEDGKLVYSINKAECDKDWNTQKNGYLYPLAWGAFNWFEYSYIPIEENDYDFDKAFQNFESWLPEDMSQGQFANWHAENAKFAIPSPMMNVYDDSFLGDQSKLESIFGQGWLKSVAGKGDFDKDWDDMVEKWLAAGGQEIIEVGNEYYKSANK